MSRCLLSLAAPPNLLRRRLGRRRRRLAGDDDDRAPSCTLTWPAATTWSPGLTPDRIATLPLPALAGLDRRADAPSAPACRRRRRRPRGSHRRCRRRACNRPRSRAAPLSGCGGSTTAALTNMPGSSASSGFGHRRLDRHRPRVGADLRLDRRDLGGEGAAGKRVGRDLDLLPELDLRAHRRGQREIDVERRCRSVSVTIGAPA